MALPEVRYNFKGGKKEIAEAVQEIGKAIFSQVSMSVQAATAAVVPSVPEMVTEIIEDLSSGPISKFEEGLKKVDTLINKFGVDIGKYSKSLGDFLKKREERTQKSETIISELREKNIVAQINRMGDVEILNRDQIRKQEELLVDYNKEIKEATKTITKFEKIQKRGGDITEEQQQELLGANKKIIETTEKRNKVLTTLNKTENEDTRTFREKASDLIEEYVPDQLRDIGSAFTEGLMAPFTAIKELGIGFMSMLKPLKLLPKLFKGFIVGMLGAIASLLPFIAIALAITVAIVAVTVGLMKLMQVIEENKEAIREFGMRILEAPGKIIKGIGDFMSEKFEQISIAFDNFIEGVKAIPGRIKTFFKNMFIRIKNFFIDMINGAIELINKVPGIEMDKLEKAPLVGENESDSPVVTGEGSPTIQAAQSGTLTTENKLPFLNTNTNQNNNSNAAVAVNNTNIANNTTLGSFASSKNDDKSRMSLYSDMSP